MRAFNQVIIEGAVGSYCIQQGPDGRWNGQFDLHSEMNGNSVLVHDCRAEDGEFVKLAGIGGSRVRVEGEIMIHESGVLEGQTYIKVKKLKYL